MSSTFLDIINQEAKKASEDQGGTESVKYPQTKHQRLFYDNKKGEKDIIMQILPSASLVDTFAEPTRKIFLEAMSPQQKKLLSNFTLSADGDDSSLLEQKIVEWTQKEMIPSPFGGQQSPRKVYVVNAVRIVQDENQNWVQERDENGELVVRIFDMPQTAYTGLLKQLQDPMNNTYKSNLSFMDINNPHPIKVSKPGKNEMAYSVSVYTNITLPPLGVNWEDRLEDLKAQVVPTEYLENGEQWVKAFIDMKEGRKPNQGGASSDTQATNPYLGDNPIPDTVPQQQQQQGIDNAVNSMQQQQAPTMPQAPNVPQQQAPQQKAPQQQAPNVPQQQAPQQQALTMPETPNVPQQQAPQQPSTNIGVETELDVGTTQEPQPDSAMPQAPQNTAQGLADIDSILDEELGGL